ncbi:diaminopimelate epimerase [Chitinophagaceae bacterium LWZ2-11]
MKLTFYKYQATGNDFIVVDNREGLVTLTIPQISALCDRRFGIGADGVLLLQKKIDFDFEMIYYNSDGTQSMCGNGGRSMVQFAFDRGIVRDKYKFLAIDGKHEAFFSEHNWINLKMKDVEGVREEFGDFVLNTGSPHYIHQTNNVMELDVFAEGRKIRYNKEFEKEGINVNFVEPIDEDKIIVRTYERGVENETLSCGTGVTASALVFAHNENGFNRVDVQTRGGNLAVEFDKIGEDKFRNIWLCGPAKFVFQGEVEL